MTSRSASRSSWTGRLLVLIVAVAGAATLLLGVRSAVTLALLESAHEAGVPQASSVRPWMTLRYLALTYDVAEDALRAELNAPSGLPPETTLKELAQQAGVSLPAYLQIAQRAIAAVASPPPSPPPSPATSDAAEIEGNKGWLARLGDDVVSAVLVYGYPALAITLALGYIASGGFEPAADLLLSLTGFLASLAILGAASVALHRSRRAAGQCAA